MLHKAEISCAFELLKAIWPNAFIRKKPRAGSERRLLSCFIYALGKIQPSPQSAVLVYRHCDWLKMKEGRTGNWYEPIAGIVRLNGAISCTSLIGQPQSSRLKDWHWGKYIHGKMTPTPPVWKDPLTNFISIR